MQNTKILGKIIVVKLVRICHLKIVFYFFIRPFYLKSGRIGRLLAIKTKKAENISITRLNMSYSIFCFRVGLWGDFLFSREFKSIQYRKILVFHLQNRTVKMSPLKNKKNTSPITCIFFVRTLRKGYKIQGGCVLIKR